MKSIWKDDVLSTAVKFLVWSTVAEANPKREGPESVEF